ncbi:pol protein [Stylonychia lemnae]|uniref:Pol protein n=1 Tax=Stylonychia lemnae TaxID=5949 RepID=A0A078AHF5_STYLE|nr:pol protein [Stylonychia lemnae]|eukprot:CDW80927.1 pol protein [Stylonychia lemnae]
MKTLEKVCILIMEFLKGKRKDCKCKKQKKARDSNFLIDGEDANNFLTACDGEIFESKEIYESEQAKRKMEEESGYKKIPKKSEYDDLIRLAHGNMHLGQNALESEVYKHYWFPNMRVYIKNFIDECPICSLKKPTMKLKKPPSLVLYEEYPLDRIQADLVELSQFLVKDEQYKYLITIIDHHSK